MKALLDQLQQRIQSGQSIVDMGDSTPPDIYPPATPPDIHTAESQLGFSLPLLLRSIYLEVANGGFGPGYGLLGLPNGARDDLGNSIVEAYLLYRQPDPDDPSWSWPDRLLPICHWGCAIYSCLDCAQPNAPVIWFDPNCYDDEPRRWDDAFQMHMASFTEWMMLWANSVDLWAHFYAEKHE